MGMGGSAVYHQIDFLWNGVVVTADVVDRHAVRSRSGRGDNTYYLEYTYKTAGGRLKSGSLEVNASQFLDYKAGDHVDLQYLETDPRNITFSGDYSELMAGLFVVGLGALFAGIFTWRLIFVMNTQW